MGKFYKKLGLLSLTLFLFLIVIVLSESYSNVYAASSGTTNGIYDFGGPLGVNNSGGAGFATLADKFVVSNGFAIAGTQLWSENQQVADSTGTLVIEAVGTAICKTFTFQDLGISSYESSGQNLTFLSVVLKDTGGATIATLSNSGTVILSSAAAQLSSLLGGSTYSYDNVASVTITWKFIGTLAPSNLNFDNITIANVVGADVTPPTVSDGTLSASGITTTGVTLNWAMATDLVSSQSVLQYQMYRSTSNNIGTVANMETNGTSVNSYTANIATYNATGLTEGTVYYFNVIVKDEAGNKTAYAMKQVITSDVTTPVVSDGTIGTTGLTDSAVMLNWTKATDAVSTQDALQYQVYQSSSNNLDTVANIEANGVAVGGYTANIGTYSVTGLTENTTYYFNIVVKDEAGNKTAYAMKQVITSDVTAPVVSDGTIGTSGLTDTAVMLNWSKATDAVSTESALQYQVYRSTSNNIGTVANMEANGTPVNSYTANIATYNATGLTEGTVYYFNVIVKDEAGNKSAYAMKQVITSDVTAPVVSDGTLSTSGITATGATLNWSKATDAVSTESALQYQVYQSGSNNLNTVANIESNGVAVGSYTANIGTYSVTGLTESTLYYFNVIVKDEAGNKTAYAMKQVITSDVTAPVVSDGTIGTTGLTDTDVTLNWTKATDAVSTESALQYQVYRSTSNNIGTVSNIEANGTPVNSYTANIATYNAIGLTEGTTYYFNVIVKDEAGNKTAYAMKQVVSLDITAPIVSDGTLSTSGITATGATLNWSKATDAVSTQGALQYQVYQSGSNNLDTVANIEAHGVAVGSYTANIGTYSVTGLTESTLYYFNVIVKDEAGNKTAYAMKQVITLDVTAPVVSDGTIGTTGLTDTDVTLNWTKATDAVSTQGALQYQVYQSSSNNLDTVANIETNGSVIGSYTTDIGTYSVTGLTEGTTYYFNIIVKDEAGNKSAFATKQVITSDVTAPVVLDGTLSTSDITAAGATLNWTKATDAVSTESGLQYQVYQSGSNNLDTVANIEAHGVAVGSYTANIGTYSVTGLTESTTYYFNVVVKDEAGNKTAYVMKQFVTPDVTAPGASDGTIGTTGLTDTDVTLNWTKATDAVSTESALQYQVYQSDSNNLDSVANIEANGLIIGSYAADLGTFDVTGLLPSTVYYFNVIVKDEAENKTAYTMKQVITDAAPTFTIDALDNQSAAALTVGYATGIQETKTITVSRTGTGNLAHLMVALSGTHASDFVITQPNETTLSSTVPTTTFTIEAKDGLAIGTYNATVTVTADNMIDETFTLTQVVNAVEPTVIVSAVPGDGYVSITWNSVGMEGYRVYQSTVSGSYGTAVDTVGGSVNSSKITGLVNSTTYYFVVRSIHGGIESEASNEVSRIPQVAAPDAPVLQSAIAGDGHVNLSWTPVTGSTEYQIYNRNTTGSYSSPLATVNGSLHSYDAVGLVNGMNYYFVIKALNPGGESAASNEVSAMPKTTSSAPSAPPGVVESADNDQAPGVDVLINGKLERIGTATNTIVNGQTVTTITVDPKLLTEKLVAEDQQAVITIPVSTNSDVVIGEFNGQLMKSMEQKQAVVVIETNSASYTLPAQQINMNSIIEKFGKSTVLQDIKIQIIISKPTADTVKTVENAAQKGGFTIVVPPLHFTIKATYGDTTIEASQFNVYVERTMAIPDGVDPKRITTGVVIDPDGTIRHVPTRIVVVENKYFAKVNSLTNSTYAIVSHPVAFKDLENHWAKEIVNDMGSRMVISGVNKDTFAPDRNVTRAEFAAMIVRALGLKVDNSLSPFKDVQASAWYNGYVKTVLENNIVTGYDKVTFAPEDKITREQAMLMIANAMKITGLQLNLQAQEAGQLLRKFGDGDLVSEWARASIAICLDAGIVTGKKGNRLEPKEFISRAEVAVLVQRLLQKSGLI
jgi:hypothetical protein